MSGPRPVSVRLDALGPLRGDGVHWTLEDGVDLNANLVHLDPGREVGAHVNDAVDVLVVVVAGACEVVADEVRVEAPAGTVVHVPRGCRRHILAGAEGVTYVTVHRRRDGGLAIGGRRG